MTCTALLQRPACAAPATRRALSSKKVVAGKLLSSVTAQRNSSKRATLCAQAVAVAPPAPSGGSSESGGVKTILANLRGHLMHEEGRQVARRDSSLPQELLQKSFSTEGAGWGTTCKWDQLKERLLDRFAAMRAALRSTSPFPADWLKAKSSSRFIRHVWHLRRYIAQSPAPYATFRRLRALEWPFNSISVLMSRQLSRGVCAPCPFPQVTQESFKHALSCRARASGPQSAARCSSQPPSPSSRRLLSPCTRRTVSRRSTSRRLSKLATLSSARLLPFRVSFSFRRCRLRDTAWMPP